MIEEQMMSLCRMWAEDSSLHVTVTDKKDIFATKYRKRKDTRSKRRFMGSPDPTTIIDSPEIHNEEFVAVDGVIISNKGFKKEGITDEERLAQYRIARFGTFHESCHVLHTSPKHMTLSRRMRLNESCFNVLEDFRINRKGLRRYIGYESEKEFSYRIKLTEIAKDADRDDVQKMFGYIVSSLNLGEAIEEFPASFEKHKHRVDSVIKDARSRMHPDAVTTDKECLDLAETLSKILDDIGKEKGFESTRMSMSDEPDDSDNPFSNDIDIDPELAKALGEKYKVPEGIAKEFEKLMRERQRMTTDVKDEVSKAETKALTEPGLVRVVRPKENAERYSTLKSQSTGVMKQLRREILKLKKEYAEVLGDSGDDIDTDLFLTNDDKFYVTEDKRKPMNDIMILVDVTGSTSHKHDKYMVSSLAVCEALSSIGVRFGMYGFDSGADNKMYLVKTLQGHYDDHAKYRLGGMCCGGNTPLGSVAHSVANTKGYKTIIVLTDGESTEPLDYTQEGFRKLFNKGFNVQLIGYGHQGLLPYMKSILHPRHINNRRVISNIEQFPKAILDLLKRDN